MKALGAIMQSAAQTTLTAPLATKKKHFAPAQNDDVSILRLMAYGINADFTLPFLRCENCGGEIQRDVVLLGIKRRVGINCPCASEQMQQQKERDEAQETQRRLNRFRVYSLMDSRFERFSFENWVHNEDSYPLYELGRRYCQNWEDMRAENHGLLIYGPAGTGKTYLSFAIANELHKQGQSVMAISVSRIIGIMQDSFNKRDGLGECEVLNTITDASLLILDDLGTEQKTPYGYKMLYSIIDARERAGKPLIITTNLGLAELRDNVQIIDVRNGWRDETERVFNRIIAMCTPFKVDCASRRLTESHKRGEQMWRLLGIRQ